MDESTRRRSSPPNFQDRTGERYGKLVVVRRAGSRSRNGTRANGGPRAAVAEWLCICDCGNEKIVTADALRVGDTTSCGCARRAPHPTYCPKNRLPPGQATRNKVLRTYRRSARDRGFPWGLTEEEFIDIIGQNCTYCGCAPSTIARAGQRGNGDFIYNGIDRKNNAIGYVTGNVLPCCTVCNRAKNDMPYDDFTTWIIRLTSFWAAGRPVSSPP